MRTEPSEGRRRLDELDRVRSHTAGEVNRQLDRRMEDRVFLYANQPREAITARLDELGREWDVERWLKTSSSVLAVTGLVMAASHSRRWLLVPAIVLSFLLQQAFQGWCPPIEVLRRLGARTRGEIDVEKQALRFLRGDLPLGPEADMDNLTRASAALSAARD